MSIDPLEEMYKQRENFIIVALTGVTGSGCSEFADIMSKDFKAWGIRNDEAILSINVSEEKKKKKELFRRKHLICREFCNKNAKPFEIIKYRNVLILEMILRISKDTESCDVIRQNMSSIILKNFEKAGISTTLTAFEESKLNSYGFDDKLLQNVINIKKSTSKSKYRKDLYDFFFGNFSKHCETLYDKMKSIDYYAKNLFVHNLAISLRLKGEPDFIFNPEDKLNSEFESENIFIIVKLINELIKGAHEKDRTTPRRFVIDSVRNSLELLYLRERYNSFYTIALHNEKSNIETQITNKVTKISKDSDSNLNEIVEKIKSLNEEESKKNYFENGLFFMTDIARCVSESEIHINYTKNNDELTFYTFQEQWMKFYSLILHPGLITPSRDERNMSIAYVAKFNSGCISRQVGCCIVDNDYGVQSIGWNDPPTGQLPCNLRFADELPDIKDKYQVYSKFEVTDDTCYTDNSKTSTIDYGKGFKECLKNEIKDIEEEVRKKGLPYSYCFRTRYNKYRCEKNAVNTRSLHAEENTMLRIAKKGGVGLDRGTMFVTASPCILCSKKAYQIGIKDIVYLDLYSDIAPDLILNCGFGVPNLRSFIGAIGPTFYKLYQPFLPYKDELSIIEKSIK